MRTSLGLDRPVFEQYGNYMKGIVVGNDFKAGAITIDCPAPCLGVSFKLRVNVTEYLLSRFPATLSLAVGGSLLFVVTGVGLGIMAARRRGTVADKLIVGGSLTMNAIPYYLLALLAFLLLISQWGIFPESGYFSPFSDGPLAWAKGLPERRVVLRHALRAAVVPVVTIFGLDFADLLAGTVFTERIFNIRGIGVTA